MIASAAARSTSSASPLSQRSAKGGATNSLHHQIDQQADRSKQ
jgi:hypothetical protein